MAQWQKNIPAMQEPQDMQVRSLSWEDSLEEDMATTPVFLPGESHGKSSQVSYNPYGHKESDTTEAIEHRRKKKKTQAQNTLVAARIEDNEGRGKITR